MKNFGEEELKHELLLTTRQATKIGNSIDNKMSRIIKISKPQISKTIQSGESFGFAQVI